MPLVAHRPAHFQAPCTPLTPAGQDLTQLAMLEGQLTWLANILGGVVRGPINTRGGWGEARGWAWRGSHCVQICLL